MQYKEFRFAVGCKDKIRSSVWKLWTKNGQFYIVSRMMGSITKLSFHSNGKAQFSLTSEFMRKQPNRPNKLRHIDTWVWSVPPIIENIDDNHVFQISIPSSELRSFSRKENLGKVHWLVDPGADMKTTVDCFVFPHSASKAPMNYESFLFALQLTEGMCVVAFMTISSVSASERQQVENLRSQWRRMVRTGAPSEQQDLRGTGMFIDSQGVHGMMELVPFD